MVPQEMEYANFNFVDPTRINAKGVDGATAWIIGVLINGSTEPIYELKTPSAMARKLDLGIVRLAHLMADRRKLACQATVAGELEWYYCSRCGGQLKPKRCSGCGKAYKQSSYSLLGASQPALPKKVRTYANTMGHPLGARR